MKPGIHPEYHEINVVMTKHGYASGKLEPLK